jgi:hypothetical protein
MVKGFGFSDFLGTEFLPDRGVEHLYAGGLAHFGGDTVGWSFRNFSRISDVLDAKTPHLMALPSGRCRVNAAQLFSLANS